VGNTVRSDKPLRCHTRLGHAGYNVLSYKSVGPEESTKHSKRLKVGAMQIKLTNITGIASPKVEHFDLHEEFGVACLVEAGEKVTLSFNQFACRSWLKQDHPHIVNIKWFNFNSAILYYDGIGAAIVSMEGWNNIRLGAVDKLFVSNSYIFVSYDEESLYGSRPNDLENNIISVFLRDGTFELGIGELMDKDRDSWQFNDLEAGYIFDDKFAFIAYASKLFWVLDVSKRSWRKFPAPVALWRTDVLSGDAEKAHGVFDNRWDRNHARPPFELAVFELVAETAWMQDFAPVENALIAAGFSMSEIKFQPSSTGKIIVSDGKNAALLEFSDSA
jgi:hypothetical protein